jgi:hypothetical protein
MRRALLLVCCLTLAATAVLTDLIVVPAPLATAAPVPKGSGADVKPKDVKPKDPEEAKKAARYKALREGYEIQRDLLPKDSLDRLDLESDMYAARDIAETLVGIERTAEPKLKALQLETWETCLKPQITKTPRRKELFEIYYYELSQKAGPVPPTPPPVRDLPDRSPSPLPYPHQTRRDPV